MKAILFIRNLKFNPERLKPRLPAASPGISLFVVMSALLILSALVISTTAQIISPAFTAANLSRSVSDNLSYRSALTVFQPILRAELIRYKDGEGVGENAFSGEIIAFSVNETEQEFAVQDIYGQIDINAASTSMMTLFLTNIGLADRATSVIQQRQVQPFDSMAAFWETASNNPETQMKYEGLLTINSGQRRVNGQTAPLQLLQILSGQTSTRSNMLDNIDARFLRVKTISLVQVSR